MGEGIRRQVSVVRCRCACLHACVSDSVSLTRGLLLVLERVEDGDDFRLYHTPGFGWMWPIRWFRMPSFKNMTPGELGQSICRWILQPNLTDGDGDVDVYAQRCSGKRRSGSALGGSTLRRCVARSRSVRFLSFESYFMILKRGGSVGGSRHPPVLSPSRARRRA